MKSLYKEFNLHGIDTEELYDNIMQPVKNIVHNSISLEFDFLELNIWLTIFDEIYYY